MSRDPHDEPFLPPHARDLETLDGARLASRACPECSGNGWATRFQVLGAGRPRVAFSMACRCALGLFYHRLYSQSSDPALRRLRWLQEFPDLWADVSHRTFDPVEAPPSAPRPPGLLPPGEPVPDPQSGAVPPGAARGFATRLGAGWQGDPSSRASGTHHGASPAF
jgi:hypothetical protein